MISPAIAARSEKLQRGMIRRCCDVHVYCGKLHSDPMQELKLQPSEVPLSRLPHLSLDAKSNGRGGKRTFSSHITLRVLATLHSHAELGAGHGPDRDVHITNVGSRRSGVTANSDYRSIVAAHTT